jgi:mannitol/fructose-specific phosphotransferase system IIA component (Ntr-type)
MSLRDLFHTTAILDAPIPNKNALIARLVALLVESGELPVAVVPEVLAAILLRESLGSSGIGGGVGLPHTKNNAVASFTGILAVCRTPVPFDALDGAPVDIVTLFVGSLSAPGAFLRALEQVSRQLRPAPFRQALRAATTAHDLAVLLESVGDPPVGRVPCPGPSDPITLDLRKARLFACACGRRCCEQAGLAALPAAERFTDGLAPAASIVVPVRTVFPHAVLAPTADEVLGRTLLWATDRGLTPGEQSALLVEIFGPRSHYGMTLDPAILAWNGGAVPRVAGTIYQSGNFADLPVLADALEDAGCTDTEVLGHLRRPDNHVRGCWALDVARG